MGVALHALHVDDDGLPCPEVGAWSETKYRLLALYDELFSTGMKNKWDQRVYIDLYAGAGYSRIQGTKTILKGSPIIALTVPNPFDKYIFCEESPELLAALKARVERIAPRCSVAFVPGSCDSAIGTICDEIPKGSPGNKVLSLCLVDPFDFGIKFETLQRLLLSSSTSSCFWRSAWMRTETTTTTWRGTLPRLMKRSVTTVARAMEGCWNQEKLQAVSRL